MGGEGVVWNIWARRRAQGTLHVAGWTGQQEHSHTFWLSFLPVPILYMGCFHFLTTFPSIPQPSPIWFLFQSLSCLYYSITDDLREKIKALDFLLTPNPTGVSQASSSGQVWGNMFPAQKPSLPHRLWFQVPGALWLIYVLLTWINVSGKLFSEKRQLQNLEGQSTKCPHWALAFQAVFLHSSLCVPYSSEMSTMIMYYIITTVSKAIKNNPTLVAFILPIYAQFTQLETSKSALMSLAASPTACWPPSSKDSQHLFESQGFRSSLLHGWATAAAVCLYLVSWL